MATGLSAANFANKVLDHIVRSQASTAPAGSFVKLHTSAGDPGAAGANNASSVTTRMAATWGTAASAGSVSITGTAPTWTNWAGTSPETLGFVSVWDAVTAGAFLYSAALTANKTVTTGDTFTLSSLTVSLSPIAA